MGGTPWSFPVAEGEAGEITLEVLSPYLRGIKVVRGPRVFVVRFRFGLRRGSRSLARPRRTKKRHIRESGQRRQIGGTILN